MVALLLLASAQAAVSGAGHHGMVTGPTIDWESTLVGVMEPDGQTLLPLASPLDAEVELVSVSPGKGSLVRDQEGRGVALALTDYPLRATRFTLKTRQPMDATLQPPLLDQEDLLQRVTLDGLVYEPAVDEGLEHHLHYMAHPEVDRRQRRSLDRLLEGQRAHAVDQPIYLHTGPRLSTGLHGEALELSDRLGSAGVVAGGIFALLLGVLVGLYKLLDRRAKEETVEAYIRGEFLPRRSAPPPRGDEPEAAPEAAG